MGNENKLRYLVQFTEEFELCLDKIEAFFTEQGQDALRWWYTKENEMIDHIDELLSHNPYVGVSVTRGAFRGLHRIVYGKNKHKILNYLIYYAIHENDHIVDVINILPSRSERRRIRI